jgi:hypothetical protein
MPCITVSFLDINTRSSAYFTVWIIFPPNLKSPSCRNACKTFPLETLPPGDWIYVLAQCTRSRLNPLQRKKIYDVQLLIIVKDILCYWSDMNFDYGRNEQLLQWGKVYEKKCNGCYCIEICWHLAHPAGWYIVKVIEKLFLFYSFIFNIEAAGSPETCFLPTKLHVITSY